MSRQKPIEPQTCPIHGEPLLEADNPVGPGRVRYCPIRGCQMATLVRNKPKQMKLGLEPGPQENRACWNERQAEREVEDLCLSQNIERLVTTVRYKLQECPECGHRFRPVGGYGATPGVPDNLLLPHWIPSGLGVLLELKGSDTPFSSPEQADLARRGRILVARSGVEAQFHLERVRKRLERE
jgi:hypothetical protein